MGKDSYSTHELDHNAVCPVAAVARIIGNKWTILTIYYLQSGRQRFSALQRAMKGVSPSTLSRRLKLLQHKGIVARHVMPTVPPQVEYELTPKGRALATLMARIATWESTWMAVEQNEGG